MIHMRNVGENHILVLDCNTDASHLVNPLVDPKKPILTFDSSTVCTDAKGEVQCRIRYVGEHWTTVSDLDIQTTPVLFKKMEGVFDIEAEFCQKWLELKGVEA